MAGEERSDAVERALAAVRHAVDATLGSTGPNHPLREAERLLGEARNSAAEAGERALATALGDLSTRLAPYLEGTRLLTFPAVETLERFLSRSEILFRLSRHSSGRPPSRAHPLPPSRRLSRQAAVGAVDQEEPVFSTSRQVMGRLDREVYEEVFEVFAMEARDQLRLLGTSLRRLRAGGDERATLEEIRRRLSALKGTSALVGAENVRLLSHTGEDHARELLDARVEPEDLDLLSEVRAVLETLALGDPAQRSSTDGSDLVQRLQERIERLERRDETAPPRQRTVRETASEGPGVPVDGAAERLGRVLLEDGLTDRRGRADLDALAGLAREVELARDVALRRQEGLEAPLRTLRSAVGHLRDVAARAASLEVADGASGEGGGPAIARAVGEAVEDLVAADLRITRQAGDLEEELETVSRRMQRLRARLGELRRTPLEVLVPGLERTARTVAERGRKEVRLEVEGAELALDTEMVESLGEVLHHLVRNAVEHGIETPDLRRLHDKERRGTIRIRADRLGPQVVVDVADDGAGLPVRAIARTALERGLEGVEPGAEPTPREAWALACRPGFSTRPSSAGHGLDLALDLLSRLGGDLTVVEGSRGGLTVRVRIPTELSLVRTLVVERSGFALALPSTAVRKVSRFDALGRVRKSDGVTAFERDGERFPVLDLARWSDGAAAGADDVENLSPDAPVLLLHHDGQRRALLVDSVRDGGELAMHPPGPLLEGLPGIIGFVLRGETGVLPVLDAGVLVSGRWPDAGAPSADPAAEAPRPSVLVVDDAASVRRVVGLLLERLGVRPLLAASGEEALALLAEVDGEPALALVDVMMPGMDGYELTGRIRELGHQGLPIYLFTSPSTHLMPVEDLPVEGYVFKPLVRRELAALLRRHSSLPAAAAGAGGPRGASAGAEAGGPSP